MHIRTLALACAGLLLSVPAIRADDILQVSNAGANVDWNQSSIWGEVPTVGNNYLTLPYLGSTSDEFTVNGTTWTDTTNLRDSTSSSAFGGGSLVIESSTRLLSKVDGTSVADIVLDGGFITWAPNGAYNSTLAGTITASASLSAIGMLPTPTGTFNLASTIVGSGTIQIVIYGGETFPVDGSLRAGIYNITGDLSAFTGTLYLATPDAGSPQGEGTGAGSLFSIADNVAPFATLDLATSSLNFAFDLGDSSLTFGSVIVDGTSLAPGTYSVDDLNGFADGKFFGSTGTITVVPEPSTVFLGVIGLLALVVIRARRPSAARA